MDLWIILLRTVLIYFLVFLALRLMGKREIGKLSVFDFVNSIMIAELAVLVIDNPDKNIWEGIVPMAALVGILLSIVTLKNESLRRKFDGPPSVIIERGEIRDEEMRKQRYTLDDLLLQLRENKVPNPADVEFAILETTGKLTVVDKESMGKERAASPKVNIRYEGLPLPLIMDGKVQDDNLQKIGQTRFWLKDQIRRRGVKDFKDVFLCTLDHKGELFIDRKDNRRSRR